MKKLKHIGIGAALCLIAVIAQTSCSMIDEDLSDCGKEYRLHYQLRLITNEEEEIETVLCDEGEQPLADALRQHLSNIFTDFGHDLDLSFYDTTGDSLRSHHEQHIMDANEKSYTIYLPVQEYMHLAWANLEGQQVVSWQDDDHCHPAKLINQQKKGSVVAGSPVDTLDSHNTGLFTARLPMHVLEGQDQDFYVHLYMANCAAALVVDTTECSFKRMWAVLTDMADSFYLCDSLYTYNSNPIIRTEEVKATAGTEACFCAVSFPSQDYPIGTQNAPASSFVPYAATPSQLTRATAIPYYWQMRLYVELPNSKITESTIYVYERLKAGNLKIIKLRLDGEGGARPYDSTVGVDVSLDWKPGGSYEPTL